MNPGVNYTYQLSSFAAKSIIALLFFMLITMNVVIGQEMLGVVNSNYAGVLGTQINPSSMVNSRLFHDVNFLSFDFFFQNNFLFIPKEDYRFRNFFRPNEDLPTYGSDSMMFARQPDWDHTNKRISHSFRINGPGVMLANTQHAVSFHTALRESVSVWRLPYHLAIFIYEDLWYYPLHRTEYTSKNFHASQLTWAEFGLSYARVVKQRYNNRWTAGITANVLGGVDGAFLYGNYLQYEVDTLPADRPNLVADIRKFTGETGFSLPMDYETNDFGISGGLFRGSGFGFNIGITYLKMVKSKINYRYKRLCEQQYDDYYYRMGISLIDLGWITFRNNAQKHRFEDVSHYWEYINETEFDNLNSFMRELSARFYQGDSTQSLVDDRITVFLPTAISGQFDYHLFEKWYVNGTVIFPLVHSAAQIHRPPQLAVTARYESDNLEVSVPLSMYYFTRPRIGLSVRFWNVTVGSDNLAGFLHFRDFNGINLYAVFKINFTKGLCLSFKKRNRCPFMEF